MANAPMRGVNLGGWLVLEKWITPSLFEGTKATDEYTFCAHSGKAERERLRKFRDTFITEDDFRWLAAHDIRAVRLPVGHWILGDEPPYSATAEYVDRAFKWAEETNLKVLLDVHAVRGSQNGRDHSGRAGKTTWHHDESNMQNSLKVIEKLARRYHESPALLGISLMNEPHPIIPKQKLLQYYEQAYRLIRDICSKDTWVIYSDGYLPARWRKELPLQQFPGMFVDTHHYQIFTPLDHWLPPKANIWRARHQLPWKLRRLAKYHPVIVGEWSLTLHDRRLANLSAKQRGTVARAYGEVQLRAFQNTAAWFFWTYKTEAGGTWSYRDCVQNGWFDIQS